MLFLSKVRTRLSQYLALMKFLKSEIRVRNTYFTAFAVLVAIYAFVFFSTIQMARRFEKVDSANNAVWNLERLKTTIKDAESVVRGFFFFKTNNYLEAFIPLESSADSLIRVIDMQSIIGQKTSIDSLQLLIKQEFQKLNIFLKTNDTIKNAFVSSQIGAPDYKLSTGIRTLIGRMQEKQKHIFTTGSDSLYTIPKSFVITNIIGFLFSVCLCIYALLTYNKENKAKRIYRHQLEEGIERLKSANKELDDLRSIEKFAVSGRIARTIAHEVRNPLTNINLACEQVISSSAGDVPMLLDMIKRNSKRINDLISDLLNSTKFSELNPSRVYIHKILDDALQLAGDSIDLHGIKIIKMYSAPKEVEVDVDKIKIAFLNIIVNAIEAMVPGKGILKVKIVNQSTQCVVSIEDNGVGMDKDSLLRIFEPYFTSKKDGNGLGLTNTHTIILNHKGKISVTSLPGIGTTFTIELKYLLELQSDEKVGLLNYSDENR